ncbi:MULTISPECIES: hypothetical protein [Wolbachia]|uniref:hypothetical protein n=1 Tax=Wolbachia TaxID=953 RepID=UPI0009D3E5F7|nr:hypothetical protein [Wolbachia pipientis]ONI58354.1 hypothetical protein N499_0011 [Wolbachia pipientis wVitA]
MAGVKYCLENKEFANKILGAKGDTDEEKTNFSRKISRTSLWMIVRTPIMD